MLLGLLLLCNALTAYGQFNSTYGFPYPTSERSPGGIITPSGGYIILGDNFDHPNGLSTQFGDMELVWPDNVGFFTQGSQILGLPAGTETAAWIENAVCPASGAAYIIAGNEQNDNMLISLVNLSGADIWTRSLGDPINIATSACVKVDANGFFILVGTQYDVNTLQTSIVAAKVNCSGTQLWNKVYTVNGYHATTYSVTAFATTPGGPGNYYITGKVSPVAGGNEEVFLLQIDDLTGSLGFMKRYDIAPNTDDVGTCIQGSLAPAPNGGIWISGYSEDINVGKNVLMMRLDLNGNVQWAKNYDLVGTQGPQGGHEFATHFEFAANGKLVVTGRAEEFTAFQATKAGECMLMRMDKFGNPPDWARVFKNTASSDFSSQGNRVEVTANDEYFVTGNSLNVFSLSQKASNILAVKTDAQGQTGCFHDAQIIVKNQAPIVTTIGFTLGFLPDFLPVNLIDQNMSDQVDICAPPPPCDCDFTWNTGNCFNVTFNANCINPVGGNYTYSWDIFCDNNPELTVVVGAPNHAFTYTFPCGGGTFQVCLKVTDPFGTMCTITHTVVVPNTCCGSVSGTLACHPTDEYKYDFTVNVVVPPGLANCTHTLTSPYPLTIISNSGGTITGTVTVTDPVPLGLGFTLQSNCICTLTGLPTTCTQSFSLATVCCKEIFVNDQFPCEENDGYYYVPITASWWSPLNGAYWVDWYAMPKPASGICPSPPWGVTPFYSTSTTGPLTPLTLFPNTLPGDLCIYAVVSVDDGPCTQVTSNVAMVQLCKPSACTLNDQEYCYMGTPIVPGPITLTFTGAQPSCISTLEWFDENGTPQSPPTPLNVFQPVNGLSLPPGFTGCYMDFFYTVILTDDCGPHECKSRVRLYNDDAPIGTLTLLPPDISPVCWAEDATLKFTPNCAGDPAQWVWYERDCIGNVTVIPSAGITNNCFNVNELHNGTWYGVGAVNGVCPNTEEMLVEVVAPAVILNFTAVADPCAEVQVVLSASVTPGTISCSNLPFPCTYTYEWYKDGFLIGTTPFGSASESFTYINPFPGPPPTSMAGNYYCIIKEDCCPRNSIPTWVVPIRAACEPTVMGPCFICSNQPVTLMAQMVLPPNIPCPDFCTFTWYDAIYDNALPGWVMNNMIGGGANLAVTAGGHYFLVSDCNGCIKKVQFDLLECMSGPGCGPVSVEELMPKDESPLRIFPNPNPGLFTVELPQPATPGMTFRVTDLAGRLVLEKQTEAGSQQQTVQAGNLPDGLYFLQVVQGGRVLAVEKFVKQH